MRSLIPAGLILSLFRGSAAEVRQFVGDPVSGTWTATAPVATPAPRLQSADTPFAHGALTDHEQYLLEWINRARANPAAEAARLGIDLNQGLAAGTITTALKPPLASHPQLLAAARAHNQWMLDNDVFSHTGVTNSNPGQRMSDAGYSFVYPAGWGENLAWRGTSAAAFDLAEFVRWMHDGLFRSAGHRVNMMNAAYDEIGVGVATGYFYSDGRDWNSSITTHTFAYSATTPGPLVVGVVFRDLNGNGFYDPGEGEGGIRVAPDSGSWFAVTSASGGYAFPYNGTGSLNVTFSEGALGRPVARTIQRTGVNLKLDLELLGATPVEIVGLQIDPGGTTRFDVYGPQGATVVVQRSVDFINWLSMQTNVMNGTPASYTEIHPPGAAAFYRVIRP